MLVYTLLILPCAIAPSPAAAFLVPLSVGFGSQAHINWLVALDFAASESSMGVIGKGVIHGKTWGVSSLPFNHSHCLLPHQPSG